MQQNYCYQCCLADICKHIDRGTHTLASPACDAFDPGMRWIPVTERLPDVPGHVLVWDNTAKIRKILWFHDCNGWGVEDKHPKRYFGNASDQRRYTHWMPLPDAPEEDYNG